MIPPVLSTLRFARITVHDLIGVFLRYSANILCLALRTRPCPVDVFLGILLTFPAFGLVYDFVDGFFRYFGFMPFCSFSGQVFWLCLVVSVNCVLDGSVFLMYSGFGGVLRGGMLRKPKGILMGDFLRKLKMSWYATR